MDKLNDLMTSITKSETSVETEHKVNCKNNNNHGMLVLR